MENSNTKKRSYSRKAPNKVELIKKELANSEKLLDTFVGMYGEEEAIRMFKPHLTYVINRISEEVDSIE